MHMVLVFYGFGTVGSIILSILYMKKYWTDEVFEAIEKIENEANDDNKGV